jgi:SAM-dependent methyltransferase
MDQKEFYAQIADLYDIMIDWKKRLEREGAFFLKLFEEKGVRRVLDSAAAGGRHVRYFRERGYEFQGADFSPEMIEQCRRADPEHAGDYFRSDFRDLKQKVSPPYDALLCLGCSLPHLMSEEDFYEALSNFAAVLKRGGTLVTQFVNFDAIYRRGDRIRPLNHRIRPEGEYFFLRVYDLISESQMDINLNVLIKRGRDWDWKMVNTSLFPIHADPYIELVKRAGFADVRLFGDYAFSPFDRDASGDLIVVAERL